MACRSPEACFERGGWCFDMAALAWIMLKLACRHASAHRIMMERPGTYILIRQHARNSPRRYDTQTENAHSKERRPRILFH